MRITYDASRTRLGRIRCLGECLKAYTADKPLPIPLCYVCKNVEYVCTATYLRTHRDINTYSAPVSLSHDVDLHTTLKDALPVGKILCDAGSRFYVNSEPIVTKCGMWLKLFSVRQLKKKKEEQLQEMDSPVWILQQSAGIEETPYLEPITHDHELFSADSELWKTEESRLVRCWLGCVECHYSIALGGKPTLAPTDHQAVAELQALPPNWSRENDEQLVHFLCEVVDLENESMGIIKDYVDAIEVSTACGDDNENNLIDGNPETFWESDGNHGQHWIRLKMKKGTVISRLYIALDYDDDNYLPNHITVAGGELEDMKQLNEVHLTLGTSGSCEECVLQDMPRHYPYIEVRIKGCKDEGIDTRIHSLKIVSAKEHDMGLSVDAFTDKAKLSRYPALETYGKKVLYSRAQMLQRLVTLIDTVLNYLVPSWNQKTGSLNLLKDVKLLLPLSRKRLALIDTFIKESETSRPGCSPRLLINRRAAAEHRCNPKADPEGVSTVFHQIYEGLKPRTLEDVSLTYKWPAHCEQWWECKFVAEGIIDQGGGFRDSLCDLAEELCPISMDDPIPLPYFIRAPNQTSADSNTSRDVYIPNPSCQKLAQYRWCGQLMGACLRGRENLVLSLPGFVWKKLTNEEVSWSTDFQTVDAAEVKLMETMEHIEEDGFAVHFAEKTWSVVLSDGTVKELRSDGNRQPVMFEERHEYIKAVKQARLLECDTQISALKDGFLSVVPEAILTLLTWQEVEKRVCGNPEISLDALRRSVHYDDIEATDVRVNMFWEVMQLFSNEDRSRFLRFVTGRKRLPCPMYISPCRVFGEDSLPESSTCSNTLYLPKYSSLKKAEEKLRYAAYNCLAIDTDVNPWD